MFQSHLLLFTAFRRTDKKGPWFFREFRQHCCSGLCGTQDQFSSEFIHTAVVIIRHGTLKDESGVMLNIENEFHQTILWSWVIFMQP